MPEQSSTPPSDSSSHTSRHDLSKRVLQLLSTTPARDISTLDLAELPPLGDAIPSISIQLDVAIEDALRDAIGRWETIADLEDCAVGVSALEYMRTWFEWPMRVGLGRFCPITKIVFRTRVQSQITLDLLRAVRRDWRTHLEAHIRNDATIDLTDKQLRNAVDEIIGIYLARQLAMQADEGQSAELEPWMEMVQKSLMPK